MWTPLQRWYWVQCLNTKTFPTARRLPIAGEGGRAREAAHGRRCRRGARSAAGVAPVSVSVSVCAYATGGAGGSRRAEGGHGALRQRANEPDACRVDLRRPIARRPDTARVGWSARGVRARSVNGDPAAADAGTRATAEGSAGSSATLTRRQRSGQGCGSMPIRSFAAE